MEEQNKLTITKKVAKHGTQAVLVIPSILQEKLAPGTLVEVSFKIIEQARIKEAGE